MKVYSELKPNLVNASSLALGFFDGVHPGHQAVIKCAVQEAKQLGITPALVTFRDHPRTLTIGKSPKLLTLIEQRLDLFSKLEVEVVLVLTFSEAICKLSPKQYVQTALVETMGAKSIAVGYNHHFGRNREGNPKLLTELGTEFGFVVHVSPPVLIDGIEVSSSRIRHALEEGDVELAHKLLERPYAIIGQIVKGQAKGKQIGFPTANLQVSEVATLPKLGVYVGKVKLSDNRLLPCVINIGYRPTISQDHRLSIEAHIFDFDQDLYDQTINLEFWHFLRSEQKFNSIDDLKNQISKDCLAARQILK